MMNIKLKSINEKYIQPAIYRNDIYRKFEKQFTSCFLNPINIDESQYVEQSSNYCTNCFNILLASLQSGIRFFIGFTGVGKTTFLKKYFNYKTMGSVVYKDDGIVIPISWNGRKIPENDYEKNIEQHISNVLDNVVSQIYKSFEYIILEEWKELIDFISSTRSDILHSLTLEEIIVAKNMGISIEQAKLQKSKNIDLLPFSSSLLKYAIEKNKKIKRIIFIVDDLESLAQNKLNSLVKTYLNIYDCMHNTYTQPIVDLIFSMRPHSFRFLEVNFNPRYATIYGNILENDFYRIYKNDIPNVKEILKKRFNYSFQQSEKPGKPTTWGVAKEVFYEIIDSLDDNMLKTISELCHLNIRSIVDCLQMILSNRVWCQNTIGYSEHPNVRSSDYRFDIVNVVRTLACGECSVYTGKKEIKFNQDNTSNVLSRPKFDDSVVFIPNLLIDILTQDLDVFPIIIIQYLDGYYSSKSSTPPQTEFIRKKDLYENLYKVFGKFISTEKINETINYLFLNRVIRKSIISNDTDDTINKLFDDDYVYLTLKGSRLLIMLESDSVLLEIYREDIKRNYGENSDTYKTSFELITEGKRDILFYDLIDLIKDIFYSEDKYQNYVINYNNSLFYELDFPITRKILNGIEKSLLRSQNIDAIKKNTLKANIAGLREDIEKRIVEIRK